MGVAQFAGAAAKSEKAVGADGVVAAVLQAALDQAGGMPTPDAKSLTKAIKVALPSASPATESWWSSPASALAALSETPLKRKRKSMVIFVVIVII